MKNKNKKKTSMKMGIIVAILLLAVGFAAVSTVLVINGTIKIKPDQENFNEKVIFTEVSATPANGGSALEGTYATASLDDKKKTITFTTQVMKDIGETSVLKYKIKNDSQYAAKIADIVCKEKDKDNEVTDEHIKITKDSVTETLQPGKESQEHTVTVEMIKSFVGSDEAEQKQIEFTCTINATAEEATTTT